MIVDYIIKAILYYSSSLTMADDLHSPTIDLLCDELRDVVEWDNLAVYLKVPYVDIEDARERYRGIWQRKMHCLKKWLQLDQSKTVHSWRTVADTVEKVDNYAVAEHIRQKYASILDQERTKNNDLGPMSREVIREREVGVNPVVADNIGQKDAPVLNEKSTRNNDSGLIPFAQKAFYQCLKIVQKLQCKVRTRTKIVALITIVVVVLYLLFHIAFHNFMPDNTNDRGQILQRLDYPITHGKKETPLFIPSQTGHFSVVSYLLHNGADPNIANEYGWTPLMTASANGHDDVIMILLEWKVPINTQNKKGEAAIFIATQNNRSSVISTLLKNGADPNIANKYGWTPLMTASANGHSYIIEILLKWRVSVNTQNKKGETAIFIASQNGHSSIISILLNNGADPNLADKHGWTPFMIASANGHHDVIQILETFKKSKQQQ